MKRVYLVEYTCRHWVGKPDPSGFGKCSVVYSDPAVAHEKAMLLKLKGHASIRITPKTLP